MSDKTGVGHWCAWVAGPAAGWDQTVLGIAIYDDEGALVYSRYAGIAKAIRRGDWDASFSHQPGSLIPPENWAEMLKTFERFGNAMSQLRWVGGNPTMVWTQESGDKLYETIVGTPPSPLDQEIRST